MTLLAFCGPTAYCSVIFVSKHRFICLTHEVSQSIFHVAWPWLSKDVGEGSVPESCGWRGRGKRRKKRKRLMRIFIKQMCKIHHLLLKWWTGIVSRDKDYDKILLLNTIGLFLAVAHWKQCGCDKTRNISKFSLNLRQTGTRERYRQ